MLRSYESCVSRARAQKPPCQAAGRRGIMSAGTRQEGTAGVASRTRTFARKRGEERMSDYELIMVYLTVLLLLATVCIGFMNRK